MDISGQWSFLIRGSELDFDEIQEKIKITPTEILRKGDIRNKRLEPNQLDVWILRLKYESSQELVTTLENLLSIIEPYKEYIHNLMSSANIVIRFFIQSELAQIGCLLPSSVIKRLAEMNIGFEISIFSWGGVEDF